MIENIDVLEEDFKHTASEWLDSKAKVTLMLQDIFGDVEVHIDVSYYVQGFPASVELELRDKLFRPLAVTRAFLDDNKALVLEDIETLPATNSEITDYLFEVLVNGSNPEVKQEFYRLVNAGTSMLALQDMLANRA